MALLSSLLLAAAPLLAATSGSAATGGCGPTGSCPCEQCDCCVESSSESTTEPAAVPVPSNSQVVEWLALTIALSSGVIQPDVTPLSLLPSSSLSRHRSSLPLFQRYCTLLI
jgi:hypothetical protein